MDAETIYNIFEEEILPAFYDRNINGVPEKWVSYIKNTFAQVSPNFTTARMIRDYQDRFYKPQANRASRLIASDYKLAKEMAAWKAQVSSVWDQIEVKNVQITDGITNVLKIGVVYPARLVVDIKTLKPEDLSVEMVITENGDTKTPSLIECLPFTIESIDGTVVTYKLDLNLIHAGGFGYAIRIIPNHPELPHRQDFSYLKWVQ